MKTLSSKKIGLFGLSANPPHYGHVKMAQYAKATLGLDEVWWVVAAQNPLKPSSGMASFADRLNMCRLIAEDYDWLKVSDIEQRLSLSKSYDTIRAILTAHPKDRFVWIIGGDNLAGFHNWHRWQDIMDMIPVAVMARPGQMTSALRAPASRYMRNFIVTHPEHLADAPKGLSILNNPLIAISSTGLRNALKETPRNIAGTSPQVAALIREKGLYF